MFDKPLVAANAARKLQKNFCAPEVAKEGKKVKYVTTKKTNTKSTVKLTGKLYSNDEREAMPLLSFQEVWVILVGTSTSWTV